MLKRIALVIGVLLLASQSYAAESVKPATAAKLKEALAKVIKGSPDEINATPIPGLYEATFGAQVFYLSEDGRYFMSGEMFDLQKRVSLTEERRGKGRLAALGAISESTMLVYPAKGKAKHTITVFTDIDCGYCRKLHQGMAEMNELGITVRYLSYPRAGVGSDSYKKAVDVWCAADRNKAMNQAKANQPITNTKACDAPIQKHMALVEAFGVSGTPAIVLESGRLIPGYMPPQQLLATLEGKQ